MKKRKLILAIALALTLQNAAWAQMNTKQTGDTTYYKTLIPEEKQGLLKNMSMIANMRFAGRNEFYNGEYTGSRFVNEQFRLEIKGQVTDRVFFRFRDRYTRAQEPQSVDNLSRSTDLAFVRVKATDKLNITAGKMCAAWGGIEFDMNPIDIYEYSDIVEYADNFLTGVSFDYALNNKHSITLQALDSRTKTFEELYGSQPNKTESKAPLALVANWTGSMFNGHFNTIWSYALHTEAQKTFMNYIALGNQFCFGKFTLEYDFKYSDEDLDRTGIVSENVPDYIYPFAVENTLYVGHWLHLHYRLNKKINLAFVGMLDKAYWMDHNIAGKNTDFIRNAWGYIPTLEFYPFSNANLRFYLNWVGRVYEYSDYAKINGGLKDYNTGRISIGFVSPLGIF
ncbi:MAG TPA: porin [Bacteroidia bacterium]|nr:porin [Bacteroidia bacterium]